MRLLVCGGRDYADSAFLWSVLDKIHAGQGPIDLLIHGDARGADSLADAWAKQRGMPIDAYPANWDEHGKAAGAIRNQHMLNLGKPDAVVAFRGGRGTLDMMARARKAGIPVWINGNGAL